MSFRLRPSLSGCRSSRRDRGGCIRHALPVSTRNGWGVECQILKDVFTDVLVHVVAQDFLALRGTRVGHVHFQAVLMAVQRKDGQFGRVVGETDARDIAVGFKGKFHRADYAGLDVERLHADSRVGRTGHGILVFVASGIFRILFFGRMAAFVPWE